MVAKSGELGKTGTLACCTRYGDVMALRGSVIAVFAQQLASGASIALTDPNMTRFLMTVEDAVALVLYTFTNGDSGEVFAQKAPSATIGVLAEVMRRTLTVPDHPIRIIGARHGGKLCETLLSGDEMAGAEDIGDYFRILPHLCDLNYAKFVESAEPRTSGAEEYDSENTTLLDVDQISALMMKFGFIRDTVAGWPAALADVQ